MAAGSTPTRRRRTQRAGHLNSPKRREEERKKRRKMKKREEKEKKELMFLCGMDRLPGGRFVTEEADWLHLDQICTLLINSLCCFMLVPSQ